MDRWQKSNILKDLTKKMAIVVGPRQSGKTWLAKEISKSYRRAVYLNYDSLADQEIIRKCSWVAETDLIIFDEIHKMPEWKNYLKGVYDTKAAHQHILVTGSARLDIYNKIGDSLAGRYFKHRLLPLSFKELNLVNVPSSIEQCLTRGTFPEPFLAESDLEADRWRRQYIDSMLSTDVFTVDVVHNLRAIRLVFDLLRSKVGSPVSYQSIAEDVALSPTTVKKYIEILEAIYVVFRVTPYSNNIARSLLKEPKIYFYDCALVNSGEGGKFENFLALSLLKHCCARNDYFAKDTALHYLRTKDGLEVDFCVVENSVVDHIAEAKLSDSAVDKGIRSFQEKYGMKAYQVVKNLRVERSDRSIDIVNAEQYLLNLTL